MLIVALLYVAGAAISLFIFYLIIKTAVRNGILEAQQSLAFYERQDTIAEITCPQCGESHAMDYPKCPFCGHVNFNL